VIHNKFVNGAAFVASFCILSLLGLFFSFSAFALTTLISGQVNPDAPPAQVFINSVTATVVPNVTANVTISNEGLTAYEYQYEWCVVTTPGNACGGGDDIFNAVAAKFLDPDEDWNTNLAAVVPTPGTYIFKLIVYFGSDSSEAFQTFSISSSGGGGGGGGGGGPDD